MRNNYTIARLKQEQERLILEKNRLLSGNEAEDQEKLDELVKRIMDIDRKLVQLLKQ